MNGALKSLIGLLLALVPHIFAFNEYYIPPPRPTQRIRMRQHIDMADSLNRDRFSTEEPVTMSHYQHHDIVNSEVSSRKHLDHNHRHKGFTGDIIYPDQMKSKCVFGLCYGLNDYPKEQIQKQLKKANFAEGYFVGSEESITLDNRFNVEEETLCETQVQSIFPEKANNTNQVEKIIVNVDGHKQGMVFETCARPSVPCKFSETFPTGYTTYCKQKYVIKKLMVYSESEDEKFVFDTFEVPSCCVCTVKKMN